MKLTTNEIAFLGNFFEGITDISLFSNINEILKGTEEKTLAEKGIYKDGKLTEQAKEILEIVAKAKKCTRLILKDSFFVVEKYAYKVNDKIVLAENDHGSFLFSSTDHFEKMLNEISEFVGKANIKTADIEITMTADEMLVFLAMVDIYRKNALLAYVGQETSTTDISFDEIIKQLNQPSPNSLVQMIRTNYNYMVPPAENIKVILEKLIKKNCAVFNNGYALTSEYAIFAKSFLIPETIAVIESFNLNDNNETVVAGQLFVSAGIRDMASFIFNMDEIEISSVSGSQMLQIVEHFLKCPEII